MRWPATAGIAARCHWGRPWRLVAEQSGRSFDPRVVEVLQRRHVELEQMARGSQAETFSLSTDIKIERGTAPAAGFAEAGDSSATSHAPAASAASGWGALVNWLENPAGVLSRTQAVAIFAGQLQELIPSDGIGFYVRADDTLLPEYAPGSHADTLSSLQRSGLATVCRSGWRRTEKPLLNGNPAVDAGQLAGLKSALAIPLEGQNDSPGG